MMYRIWGEGHGRRRRLRDLLVGLYEKPGEVRSDQDFLYTMPPVLASRVLAYNPQQMHVLLQPSRDESSLGDIPFPSHSPAQHSFIPRRYPPSSFDPLHT